MASFAEPQLNTEGVLGEVDTAYKIIVGIDFGTTYSGVAWGLTATPDVQHATAPGESGLAPKTRTTLILSASEHAVIGFGKAAMETLVEEMDEAPKGTDFDDPDDFDFLLFERFKMLLKDQDSGFDTLKASSSSGEEVSLMVLIGASLRILKDHALEDINKVWGGALELDLKKDIKWVITIPAIWTEFGKQFMRRAAVVAEIVEKSTDLQLLLAYELECAALAVHACTPSVDLLSPGVNYMILDCGGETVDITGHCVKSVFPLVLNATIPADGGEWGGSYVNAEFYKFIRELVGETAFEIIDT